MPQHRDALDRMKYVRILLDDTPHRVEGAQFHSLASSSLDTRYSLSYTQAPSRRLLYDTGQDCFRDQVYYCVIEQGGKSAAQCSSSLPNPFDLAAQT